MEILNKKEVEVRFPEILARIKQGEVFIHPTDTIYGLGCNAGDEKAVQKIRKLKERPDSPFSVWVPSISWIQENCLVNKKAGEWLKKLPGPYTLVLKLKNRKAVAKNISGTNTLGVRLPDHWFSEIVHQMGIPLVTTSANKAGQPFMTSLENLDAEIQKGVSFIIYEGEKKGRPSQIVNLVEVTVKER